VAYGETHSIVIPAGNQKQVGRRIDVGHFRIPVENE
jgi:hypothetical protein